MTETKIFDVSLLPISINYVGETVRDNDWRCDQWRITLQNRAGQWNTDYFTGLGHRKVNKWKESKPVKPEILGVLHSLFMDAQAADYNFSDWCAEYGYSDDSMKAFNIYKQCCEIAVQLRKYFNAETRTAIQQAIVDY